MAWKIEPKSIKKLLENKMKKRRHRGGVLEASWGVLEAEKISDGSDAAGSAGGGG